ncbi:MBL fold metallo-hydrolase [Bacillus salitolerans]|uniref:MBL fold metallo-hydrolase n=1 Tax=Bacillus salitolerans TaxID=1437434 RepID=A0ABW4LWJ3_9BACI
MKILQIRNATLLVHYGGKKILVDPFLANKGVFPAFPHTPNQDVNNPTVDLPPSIDLNEILNVDAVIITHLHPDHFDSKAKELLRKDILIFAQPGDVEAIREDGFTNVQGVPDSLMWEELTISRTSGRHGVGEIGALMGEVSGFVFHSNLDKPLYMAGDTIWCEEVSQAIERYQPGVMVVNGGAAQFLEGPITMTKEDIVETSKVMGSGLVLVSHMEALNHCLLSREELSNYLLKMEMNKNIFILEDGEMVVA